MPIQSSKAIGAIAAGAIDLGLTYADAKVPSLTFGSSPGENAQDIGRAALTVLTYIGAKKLKGDKAKSISEGFFYGEVPLVMKTGANIIASLTGSAQRFYPPNRPVTSQRGQIMVRRPNSASSAAAPGRIPGTIF